MTTALDQIVKWYLFVISELSHSALVFILRCISVWLSLSRLYSFISFHYSCFLSFVLQLRLVRHAVPLLMIGCLYYKVCHFLAGLCSSLYCWSHYRTVCKKRKTVRSDMSKGEYLKMEVAEENDNGNWIITRHQKWLLPYYLFCSWRSLNGCHIHTVIFSAVMRCYLKYITRFHTLFYGLNKS